MTSYVRKSVRLMTAYAPGEQIAGAVKLNTNECAWDVSPRAMKALTHVTSGDLRMYPSPLADRVRNAAADVFQVAADQVLVGNGSDDCLTVIMRTFLEPGDTVACAWPTYSLYDTLAAIQNANVQHVNWSDAPNVPFTADSGGVAGWCLPISNLLASDAKVVIVATPNNPSGTLVPAEQLEALARQLRGILVIDEAYIDYACALDGTPADAAASFIPRIVLHPNVIVLRTFSKSYSLAGARLGLSVANSELIGHMNKVKDSYNVNALTQIVGEAALRDRIHLQKIVGDTIREREWLIAACGLFGWSHPKTDANFVLFDLASKEQAVAVYEGLKQEGVLVRYWGNRPELSTKLRVTIGARADNERFVDFVSRFYANVRCDHSMCTPLKTINADSRATN